MMVMETTSRGGVEYENSTTLNNKNNSHKTNSPHHLELGAIYFPRLSPETPPLCSSPKGSHAACGAAAAAAAADVSEAGGRDADEDVLKRRMKTEKEGAQ